MEPLKRIMMRSGKLVLTFLFFIHSHFGVAQSGPSGHADTFFDSIKHIRIYKLPGYTLINSVSWRDSVYQFAEFEYGRITFATGFSPEDKIRLNYNLYMGQMQMITNNGDTSYVKRLKELKFISIGDHLFYHDYKIGYIEVIHKSVVTLGVLNFMITADSDVRSTTSRYDRYYVKKGYYYFLDKDNKPFKASRGSIQRLFHDHQKNIKAYLGENKIDFQNKNHLLKLLKFCNELSDENQN